MLSSSTELRDKLENNTVYFRENLSKAGFNILNGDHPIIPIMLNDANLAQNMADDMIKEGIYVTGFYFPVVPKNKARIRVQISAAMEKEHLDYAISCFEKVGKKYSVI